jgi:hypothetical protein
MHGSRAFIVLLVAALLQASTNDGFAQAAPTVQTDHASPAQAASAQTQFAQRSQELQNIQGLQEVKDAQKRTFRYTSKSEAAKENKVGWDAVNAICTAYPPATTIASPPSPPVFDLCSQTVSTEVNTECAADGQLFTKDEKKWGAAEFALVLASAAFTGVGSAATIAGSTTVPKIFSTLGGTTGLGAVTATVNTNVSSDQAGVASVSSELTKYQTYLQTGGSDGKSPPTPAQIYQSGPNFIAQCTLAANASPASAGKTGTTPKPAGTPAK